MKTTANRLSVRLEALAQPRRPRVMSQEQFTCTRFTLAPLSERLLQLAKPKVAWNTEIAEKRKEAIRNRAAVSSAPSEVDAPRVPLQQEQVNVQVDLTTSQVNVSEPTALDTEPETVSEEHDNEVAAPSFPLQEEHASDVEDTTPSQNNSSEPISLANWMEIMSEEHDNEVAAPPIPLQQQRANVEENLISSQVNSSEPIPLATVPETVYVVHEIEKGSAGLDNFTNGLPASLAEHLKSEEGKRESNLITTGISPFLQEHVDGVVTANASALPMIVSDPDDVSNISEQMKKALAAGGHNPRYFARYLEHLAEKRIKQRIRSNMPTPMALDASALVNAGGKSVRQLRSLFTKQHFKSG